MRVICSKKTLGGVADAIQRNVLAKTFRVFTGTDYKKYNEWKDCYFRVHLVDYGYVTRTQ